MLLLTIFAARNPPPFCVGTGVPLLNLCVRLYNIRVQNYNVHVCINLELQFASRPLIVVSFDCVRVGIDGVGIEKPSATRVVIPDPVRYKHTGKIISLIPDTLSAAYINMNSDWNEWSQESVTVAKLGHSEIIRWHECLGKSHHTDKSQVQTIRIFITG